MTTIALTHSGPGLKDLANAAGRRVGKAARAIAAYYAAWRAAQHLYEIDDRLLDDIGIRRAEIVSVVYGHADSVKG